MLILKKELREAPNAACKLWRSDAPRSVALLEEARRREEEAARLEEERLRAEAEAEAARLAAEAPKRRPRSRRRAKRRTRSLSARSRREADEEGRRGGGRDADELMRADAARPRGSWHGPVHGAGRRAPVPPAPRHKLYRRRRSSR